MYSQHFLNSEEKFRIEAWKIWEAIFKSNKSFLKNLFVQMSTEEDAAKATFMVIISSN